MARSDADARGADGESRTAGESGGVAMDPEAEAVGAVDDDSVRQALFLCLIGQGETPADAASAAGASRAETARWLAPLVAVLDASPDLAAGENDEDEDDGLRAVAARLRPLLEPSAETEGSGEPDGSGRHHHVTADRLLRFVLSRSGAGKALLVDFARRRGAAQPNDAAAELLESADVEVMKDTYVDPVMRLHQTDILYKVTFAADSVLAGRSVLVYLLIENKGQYDRNLAFQVDRYKNRIQHDHVRNLGPDDEHAVPGVIVLVINTGDKWDRDPPTIEDITMRTGTSMDDMMDLPFGCYHPKVVPPDEMPEDEFVRVGFLLATERMFDYRERFLAALLENPDLETLTLTFLKGRERTRPYAEALASAMELRGEKGVNEMAFAVEEALIAKGEARGRAEGEARGRAEGEARGRAEGEAEGRADSLIKLLQRDYGDIGQDGREKIRAGTAKEVEAWFEMALNGASPGKILGGH